MKWPIGVRVLAGVSLCLVVVRVFGASVDAPKGERAVENLAAFGRAYGYVRCFYPSDEAAEVDWSKLTLLGEQRVVSAVDSGNLVNALENTFGAVAPLARFSFAGSISPASRGPAHDSAAPRSASDANAANGDRFTFWEYQGFNPTEQPGPYTQRRVINEAGGVRGPLFPAVVPPPVTQNIGGGVTLDMPCALRIDADGQTERASGFEQLRSQLRTMDAGSATYADWRVRCAAVIDVWAIFEHFHPYLTASHVDWDAALAPALREALAAHNKADMYRVLMAMIAKSADGHGFVYGRPPSGWLPLRVTVVDDKIVVAGVSDNTPLRRGDVIVAVDGRPAMDILADRERVTSGGPVLRRFRALNQFDEGPVGTKAVVELIRDGARQTVEFTRVAERRSYFFNSIPDFQFPAVKEVKPGIYYVNLYACDVPTLEERLPYLAKAHGVIFDWRFGGTPLGKDFRQIEPHRDVIPHLIAADVQASPMLVPQITRPDRAGWSYHEGTWAVHPAAPRLKGRVVFINEPSVVSYGETCMAMIADYHLATLVGAPTAGTNGNANFITLPEGLKVMWTGMDVRKHDESPFYSVGFLPDYPVQRTIEGIKNGRDEYLEKAIGVIEADEK